MKKYFPSEFEQELTGKWEKDSLYNAKEDSESAKKYVLDMFPYPSGDGLHVGHIKGYVATDILSRYYRARGFNVLHPMGWDAFGLPAENYAIKKGVHPAVVTNQNINNFKRQMRSVGLSYDWSKEVSTIDPGYYKWTQWIFLKLFEKGLAYQAEAPINWCPSCKTGLANEEVVNGKCERCGSEVERKVIRQWILKITEYADRLLEDLEGLDWPDSIKQMQKNWIGRSEGTTIKFQISNFKFQIETFTTRIDTVFGVTAIIVAPEHLLNNVILNSFQGLEIPKQVRDDIEKYVESVKSKSDLERTELNKDKTGVFTGLHAINPVNGEKVPVWVADYVLGFYGTGAVMFVPGHDERDREFAEKFNLPVKTVIDPKSNKLINSEQFNGLVIEEAKVAITNWLEERSQGDFHISYKLRDWIFSRQRYWGEPIPIIYCRKCLKIQNSKFKIQNEGRDFVAIDGVEYAVVPVPEKDLPVMLPEVEKYEPTGTGESPLAGVSGWVNTTCPECGGPAKRETNTMPQWAGSCWYYLRFTDPGNKNELVSASREKYWMPVDFYVGGAEHAVLHLLYARFWHKVLFDIGAVNTKEPFLKLRNVGLVLAEGGVKMSKSKGNVVSPDELIKEYGADTLRMYEMFMGPFESAIAWDSESVSGVYKFLNRVWEVMLKSSVVSRQPALPAGGSSDKDIEVALNKLTKKVGEDIELMKFNTAIAAMMQFINLVFNRGLSNNQKGCFLRLLSPFAPFIADKLWEGIGGNGSVHSQKWPEADKVLLGFGQIKIGIQINGKVRDTLTIDKELEKDQVRIEEMARKSEKVRKYLNGQPVKKTIFVPGKILSFVT